MSALYSFNILNVLALFLCFYLHLKFWGGIGMELLLCLKRDSNSETLSRLHGEIMNNLDTYNRNILGVLNLNKEVDQIFKHFELKQ